MELGECRLCRVVGQLHASHIFPKGLYKRFVSDLTRGGAFISLRNKKETSKQFVRYWFCTDCEQRLKRGEDVFYSFLKDRPASSHCDPLLCYFAVSISWRCALFYFEDSRGEEWVAQAMERWRTFLLDQAHEPEPYSQYLISIEHLKWHPWNRGLGGFAMPNLNHVFSMVGPFIILGISRPQEFTAEELKLLEPAKLTTAGGTGSLDEKFIDSIFAVKRFRTAFDFMMTVSQNQLLEIAERQKKAKRRP